MMKTQMLRFGMSGVVGYLVDSIVLYAAMALGMGFLRGRLVSFVCAVIVTFFLNRRYTFAEQLQQAAVRAPLWREFSAYLAAMALGGLLNLATYGLVVMVIPHFPALFALAVGAGSLVGMVANFASAKWLVFAPHAGHSAFTLPRFELTTGRCLLLVQIVFWSSHLHEVDLPGLYMDAVNPDYLAARTLNPELPNWVGLQPTAGLPVLGSLYHGVQTYYVGTPVFALLGFNMLALRVAQGLFASGILLMTQLVLQRVGCSLALACAGALAVATELAFIASFRTQMYIVMGGAFWLLLAIYLALGRRPSVQVSSTAPEATTSGGGFARFPGLPWFLSGTCAGLAVYSYFVFLFFVPVFVLAGWWHTRNWRSVSTWLIGFAVGMQTYVLGHLLAIGALGGIGPWLEWIRSTATGLDPMSSEQTLPQRAWYALSLLVISLQNVSNGAMIFGSAEAGTWATLKTWLLMLVPIALLTLAAGRGWMQRNRGDTARDTQGLLASWHVALLPISFLAVSMVFGNRLWAHHFSPLVPLSYVVLFIAIHQLSGTTRLALPKWVGVVLLSGFVVGNLHQQQGFFERLTATGGTGLFSNAINRMSEDALNMSPSLVHVFPEWGFAMPFALLTGNRRNYEVYIDPETLQRLADAGTTVRLYYWKAETESSYRDTLLAQGFRIGSSGNYLQRDQNPAFYWLEAVAPGSPQ